ncbi:MAG: hypothetical protein ACTII7_11960 [Galactobacter sp.]
MAVPHRNDLPLIGRGKRGRGLTRSIITAGVLAVAAVILGVVGFQRVTVQPTHSITFEVEEGLPLGITQESVMASAEEYDAKSYEPFTMRVVERELTWAETYRGETGDADVLFSVGSDSGSDSDKEGESEFGDRGADTVLPDFNRVAFKGEGSSKDGITESRAVREAFVNNQTLGHGPGAVVGAALTAADVKFNGGNRSFAFWGSLAALPMFGSLLVAYAWMRDRRTDRRRAQQLSAAQLRLARVVLEMDSLEVRFEVAKQVIRDGMAAGEQDDTAFKRWLKRHRQADDQGLAKMEQQWKSIRSSSLALAKKEERLQAIFRDRAAPEGDDTLDQAVKDLEAFQKDTEALQRKAAALADASELRLGHAGSRSVLDQLAAPLIQAVDDVLYRKDQLPPESKGLEEVRDELLALSLQAASADDPVGADDADEDGSAALVRNHADLLKKWGAAEARLLKISADLEKPLRSKLRSRGKQKEAQRSVKKAAEERAEQRILSMTAGQTKTFRELRETLGLGYGTETGPQQAVEGVLVLLDWLQRSETGTSADQEAVESWNAEQFGAAKASAGLLIPVLAALGLGWVAVAQIPQATSYGLQLTGDKELQALNVYGDVNLLPEAEERYSDDLDQAGSLNVDYIRERMQRSLKYTSDRALFPEELALTVAIVPADDYIEYQRNRADSDNRMEIDYWQVVEGQRKLKEDVAKVYPEVVDTATGDIARGQGIVPVWVLDEETYAVGYTLTGQISSGMNSRVGRYSFQATEPSRRGPGENNNMLIGDTLTYDLGELARAMEYNHLESSNVDPKSVFWMTSISAWTGIMTLGVLWAAVQGALRQRTGNKQVRAQLGTLRTELNNLALGLDMTRLDLVAVLGGEKSATGGDAEESEQRLYEAGLVTAWRELDALEGLPRKLQKGEDWNARMGHVRQLVDMLGTRSEGISARTEQLLRSQRRATIDA